MRTIAAINLKGGVGKTSTTHHLAGALAPKGLRILAVDNDPQASLSRGFFGPDAVDAMEPEGTILSVYAGNRPFPEQVILPTGIPGVDLLPGSRAASVFNTPAPEWADPEQQECLRSFLAQVGADYDYCLIDCPPNLALCSYAALAASDFLVVPLQPEEYGSQGIRDVAMLVDLVREGPNPGLDMLGYLLTMVAREAIQQAVEATLRDVHGDLVFAAVVPRSPAYKEAISFRKPIHNYKPKGEPARKMMAVADELIARVESREARSVEAA